MESIIAIAVIEAISAFIFLWTYISYKTGGPPMGKPTLAVLVILQILAYFCLPEDIRTACAYSRM